MKPGPAPRPRLSVVREGNAGHHTKEKLEGGLKLPPGAPPEPDWRDWWPVTSPKSSPAAKDNKRARDWCKKTWAEVVKPLDRAGLLTSLDATVLADYCNTAAQLMLANRSIAVDGLWVAGERGAQKNPATTIANQLRTALKFYAGQLGLTPVARDGLALQGVADDPDDDEDDFDV